MTTRNRPRDAAVFGVDIGKNIFHVVGLDSSGQPVQRARFRRDTLLQFFERAAPASSEIFADSAYHSQKNEKWLASKMLVSRIHRRKPASKPMPPNIARANAAKSSIRAAVEHVFAHQKNRFGLFIRTIGIARAEAKLTLANIAYNFDRLIFHEQARAMG